MNQERMDFILDQTLANARASAREQVNDRYEDREFYLDRDALMTLLDQGIFQGPVRACRIVGKETGTAFDVWIAGEYDYRIERVVAADGAS